MGNTVEEEGTGDDHSAAPEELTYYHEKYGDWGGGSSEGSTYEAGSLSYWQEKYGSGSSAFDPSAFMTEETDTDRALAWFRLILSCFFIVIGTSTLVKFHRSRWILDIRTRSARLVLMGGAAVTSSFLVTINESLSTLYGARYSLDWFWTSLLLFFVTLNLFGSYICRALRLAVVFHPRAKRALPWLIPERNYVFALLILGFAFLAIPIYQDYTLDAWEVIPEQTDILATVSLVFSGVMACIYPFIRKVDDLFNISTELILVNVFLMIYAVGQKCVYQFGGPLEIRWIGKHLPVVISAIVFGISVVAPLLRLAFDPLAASKRNYADRVLLSRSRHRSTQRTASSVPASGLGVDSEDEERTGVRSEGEGGTMDWQYMASNTNSTVSRRPEAVSATVQEGVWNFERLATTPLLAAAFEDYSRKALCHESVLFLSEVSRYQSGDFSEPSGVPGPSQFDAFCRLAHTFIKAGAREEVNISDHDKRRIVNIANAGRVWFYQLDNEERRFIFRELYMDVKNMLEANLLRRFLQSEQFQSVRAQREHVTTMMVSPPK